MNNQHEHWNIDQLRIPETKIQSAYAEAKEREFPRSSQIVDLGGGQGHDAEYFISQGHEVTLLDLSEVALQRAREKIIKTGEEKLRTIKVVLGEEPIPLPAGSQDIAYSRLALHFFNKAKTKEVLKQIKTSLKPGGKAFITVKSPADTEEMKFLAQTAEEIEPGVFDDKGQIKNRFTQEEWQVILSEAGITNFSIKPYIEDISGRGDITKSGNTQLVLTEIEFTA